VASLLCQKHAIGETDVALISESWVYEERIRGLCNIRGHCVTILFSPCEEDGSVVRE